MIWKILKKMFSKLDGNKIKYYQQYWLLKYASKVG